MIQAWPLQWPDGWQRTESAKRIDSSFKTSPGKSRDGLIAEIARLRKGQTYLPDPVISSDLILRKSDNLPMTGQRTPDDPGVAVYFLNKGKQMCFACDRYRTPWENIHAIKLTIEAIRGIERWGASDMMERALNAFVALEGPTNKPWWIVLGVSENASQAEITQAYRNLRSRYHPDREGGDEGAFVNVQQAYEKALKK